MLDRKEIKEILPHREPFLLLDQVSELEPGKRARGLYYVDPGASWFAGHFPNYPVFPGVLQIEALAQLGAVAILCQEEMAGKLALFAGLDEVKFRRQVRPGETLELEVEIIKARKSFGLGQGRGAVSGEPAFQGLLKFALAEGGRR
ncbi:MAG: 3-hydroxyacyl-ACP dehydratase FabZ [Bacillota bacterium]|jgi:3-hydroxyacyl-[acyl-carrier-protein] dehydratase|nr:3-hydroxyacyl-ACP dehydratase FabZ [Bacillota bacterium]HPZ21502.1 3-hydroxyacyl-ACP dehydratase FabZ [Bacillota bacterium]HQD19362.1 3-hydroxyacyl-ACP dehydratase FabZ [Bacillota bacterium]